MRQRTVIKAAAYLVQPLVVITVIKRNGIIVVAISHWLFDGRE